MTDFLLFGARGRMGRIITSEFESDQQAGEQAIHLIAGIEHSEHPDLGHVFNGMPLFGNIETAPQADVWVDFSLADPALQHAHLAQEKNIPIVIAATGFSAEQLSELRSLAERIPVLLAANLSLGIGVMDHLLGIAAQMLNSTYDVSITESHHKAKIDAPSGTALRLAEQVSRDSGSLPQINSIRAGGIIGEHEVRFAGLHEELTISHRAFSRTAFSSGLCRAIEFVFRSKPGFYSIRDLYRSV